MYIPKHKLLRLWAFISPHQRGNTYAEPGPHGPVTRGQYGYQLPATLESWCPMLLLLLSCFSRVRLCVTPETSAHQAPPSLGSSMQVNWSGLQFPSPMHKTENWKWSRSVVSDSSRPHGLQPTRLLRPWDFPGKSTAVGCHCLLRSSSYYNHNRKLCFFLFVCMSFVREWESLLLTDSSRWICTNSPSWSELLILHSGWNISEFFLFFPLQGKHWEIWDFPVCL